jgi:hydrogenase expression/formation protein HypD
MKKANIMEVCGTHTNAIAKSGLKTLLESKINFISGPGCPVCVSAQSDIDNMVSLALNKNTIIATFGDMLRVPGTKMSLQGAAAKGADIRLVYSPLDAIFIAKENPLKRVVFLAVGFETTAPLVAACAIRAKELKLKNFYLYCCLKIITPAIKAILEEKNNIDGFLLPGNVCVVTGYKIFSFMPEKYKKPAVAAGFEAGEIIKAINILLKQKTPAVKNAYAWAKPGGNKTALSVIAKVFKPQDGPWRGFGTIKKSTLGLKAAFKDLDAKKTFRIKSVKEIKTKCRCALILKGKITPLGCPYFARNCTPLKPMGPCMVSAEGACAAYFNNLK